MDQKKPLTASSEGPQQYVFNLNLQVLQVWLT